MSAPYPTDSVSSARNKMDSYAATGSRAKLTQEQIDSIAAAARELDNPLPTAENRTGAQVVIIFIVTKFTFIPVLFFLVLPKKVAEMAGPFLKAAARQLLDFKNQAANLMAGLYTNIAKMFKPLQTLAHGIQKAITNVFQASLEAFKAVQRALAKAMAKISAPRISALSLAAQAFAKFGEGAAQLKGLLSGMFGGASGSAALSNWAKLHKMGESLSHMLEHHMHKLGRKLDTRFKQAKERIIDPLKHAAEVVAAKVHESAAAVVAQIQDIAIPIINLAVTASLALKELAEGQLKNIVRVAQAVSNQVNRAMRAVSNVFYRAYKQILMRRMLGPLMASAAAGWERVYPVMQKVSRYLSSWLMELLRKIVRRVRRIAVRLQILLSRIKEWAKRKWKEELAPVLREIPRRLFYFSKQLRKFCTNLFWVFIWALTQLAMLFIEIGRSLFRLVKEAFKEVAVQAGMRD